MKIKTGLALTLSIAYIHNAFAHDVILREPRSVLFFLIPLLLLLIVAQAFVIVRNYQINKARKSHNLPELNPQLLSKTRQQLYREIARHESTEILLHETQQYLQSIINSMPNILIGVTVNGYVTHWNSAAFKATKLRAEEVLGTHISQVYPELPITAEQIENAIETGETFTHENYQQGSGSNATFVDVTLYPLIADDVRGAVILVVDVTKQIHVESMMIQSDKMMSLGEMAAGMAHELNNPLAGILNNAQNVSRRISSDLKANTEIAEAMNLDLATVENYLEKRGIFDFLESIRKSGEQAAQIVKNMLEFSRANYQVHNLENISELIDDALALTEKNLELRTSTGIEMPKVNKILSADLPPIPCSATEIKQVLINLIRNAAQAFQSDEYGPPLDPQVIIEVETNAEFMVIRIKDNGPGMTEKVKRHIFEPFFTTKDVGKGTGLGLSVTYFIVTEHHGGSIHVESWPGEGTIFTIKLPLTREPIPDKEKP